MNAMTKLPLSSPTKIYTKTHTNKKNPLNQKTNKTNKNKKTTTNQTLKTTHHP